MTTWVLLRGLMREARHWGQFPALFAEQMQHGQPGQHQAITVITPDFAGNGSRHGEPSAATVQQMASQLRANLQQQGHAPPYHVLALSLGAMAGVAWASQYPGDVARLVLMNTSLQPFNPFHHRLRPHNYPALLGLLLADQRVREQTILRITSNHTDAAQAACLLQSWQQYATQNPVSRRNILRQLLAAMRYRASAQAPPVPLLMLASRQDRLVSVDCSRKIAALWQCPLQLHDSAGHDLPLDDGAWVVRQIQSWMAGAG
jgi:pimeloyl-ACP methyl ester carboxylesterase